MFRLEVINHHQDSLAMIQGRGEMLYNYITGLISQPLPREVYTKYKRYTMPEVYNLKYIKC
jgi:hypothetical protein